jgi:hypothetical protein
MSHQLVRDVFALRTQSSNRIGQVRASSRIPIAAISRGGQLAGAVDGRTSVGLTQGVRRRHASRAARAHQANGRAKPRFGRAETERALELLQSTTTVNGTSAAPARYGCRRSVGARPSTTRSTRGRPCIRPEGEAHGTGTVRGIRVGFGRRSEATCSKSTRRLNDCLAA